MSERRFSGLSSIELLWQLSAQELLGKDRRELLVTNAPSFR
jgi:hypothetical protein